MFAQAATRRLPEIDIEDRFELFRSDKREQLAAVVQPVVRDDRMHHVRTQQRHCTRERRVPGDAREDIGI